MFVPNFFLKYTTSSRPVFSCKIISRINRWCGGTGSARPSGNSPRFTSST